MFSFYQGVSGRGSQVKIENQGVSKCKFRMPLTFKHNVTCILCVPKTLALWICSELRDTYVLQPETDWLCFKVFPDCYIAENNLWAEINDHSCEKGKALMLQYALG